LELCKRAWVRLSDPGPYDFKDGVEWGKVLQGDTYWLFFEIRKISYGPLYEFTYRCEHCNTIIRHDLNLEEDLTIRVLSDEAKGLVSGGQLFETKLPQGQLVKFKLLTAADEAKVTRLAEGRDMMPHQAAVALRLAEIEGESAKDPLDFARYIEGMNTGDFDLLREAIEECECGIDTDIIVVCDNKVCGVEDIVTLPLQMSFFQKRKMRSLDRVKRKKAKLEERRAISQEQ